MDKEKDINRILQLSFADSNRDTVTDSIGKIDYILKRLNVDYSLVQQHKVSFFERLGKTYCFESNPNCNDCPIVKYCDYGRQSISHTPQINKSIPFIDLFCGAGGLSLGLEQFNFMPKFALDFNKSASQTYLFNRPFMKNDQFFNGDIKEFQEESDIPKAPIIVGGPPCQGFSNANRQRLSDDPRNHLYRNLLQLMLDEVLNGKVMVKFTELFEKPK